MPIVSGRRPENRITHLVGVHETGGVVFRKTTITVLGLDVEGTIKTPTRKIPKNLRNKKVLWATVNMNAKKGREVRPGNFEEVVVTVNK